MIHTLNKIGFYLLLVLLSAIPFHFKASELGIPVYYREIISSGFILLLFINLLNLKPFPLKIRKEVFFLILFPFLLSLSALYDPMESLYNDEVSIYDITNVEGNLDPRLYVLRNSLLYLPMVFYFALRGISIEEINKIAILSIIVAPFSVLFYLINILESKELSVFLLGEMSEKSGIAIEYNSYVPYLSFPVISGIYLLLGKHNSLTKLLTIIAISFVTIFIILSTSRQTLMFIIISCYLFIVLNRFEKNYKKIILPSIAILIGLMIYQILLSGYAIDHRIVEKYTINALSLDRVKILHDSFLVLQPFEYLTGAGLTSVLVSGPHNDYMRWMQRVGIFFMIISFIPFYSAAFKCFLKRNRNNNDLVTLYLGLAIFFIIYHSFFGYPREDAYQAVWSFLGITMWLAYTKQKSNIRLLKE